MSAPRAVFVPVALARTYLCRRWNRLMDELDVVGVFTPRYHAIADELDEIEDLYFERKRTP